MDCGSCQQFNRRGNDICERDVIGSRTDHVPLGPQKTGWPANFPSVSPNPISSGKACRVLAGYGDATIGGRLSYRTIGITGGAGGIATRSCQHINDDGSAIITRKAGIQSVQAAGDIDETPHIAPVAVVVQRRHRHAYTHRMRYQIDLCLPGVEIHCLEMPRIGATGSCLSNARSC